MRGISCLTQKRLASQEGLCSMELLTLVKVKGKAGPLQDRSGPEVSRKLRFPDFMTTTQNVGKVVSLMHRPHSPSGISPGTHFC
jgi:hypothetical protein